MSVRRICEWLGLALGAAAAAITVALRLPGNLQPRNFVQGGLPELEMLLLLVAGTILGLGSRRSWGVAGGVACLLCLPLWLLSVYVLETLP